MATQILSANQSAFVRSDLRAYNDHESANVSCFGGGSKYTSCALLTKFPARSSEYEYFPIIQIGFNIFGYCGGTTDTEKNLSALITYAVPKSAFDVKTATWSDAAHYDLLQTGLNNPNLPLAPAAYTGQTFCSGPLLAEALTKGIGIYFSPYVNGYISVATAFSTNPPIASVSFGSAPTYVTIADVSPADGASLNRSAPVTILFSPSTKAKDDGYSTLKTPEVTSWTVTWRKKGTTATQTISGSPAKTSLIVPANTFPSGEIEYQITVVSNTGGTYTTDWVSISTVDTIPVATPLSPDSSLEDGTQAITFRWTHSNESGSAQTKAELQKSADGSAWTTLGTVTGASNEYAAPAGTFTSGTWYWRVRTYNLDGAAGEWSTALSFVVVAGPTKPVIVVKDASPRPLINWQTSEQSAYQLQLDDIIDITEYGSEKTWRCPVYLDDGAHTFRVRSQNSYGLWSEWGSATFTVSHTAGGAIALTVDADHRAELSWSYAGSWTEFVVYRDGVAIAKATDYSYTDDYSVGTVRYQVRACASDGTYNYSLSNEVTVSVMPETVMLSALGSGKWLFLRLSTAQHRTNTIKASRTFSLTHLSGRKFPEAELTEFCDRSISVSYATDDEDEKAALEALMGSPVCLKTPGGKMVIGILDTLSETESMFYSSYSFAVSQMHYPEEVDLDA